MTTACPNRQQLLDYVVGKLDEPALDVVSQHVEQCGTCQSLLSTLDDSADTVLLRLRRAPVVTGFEHEPEYQQAVAAAKAVVPGAAAVIPPSAAVVARGRPMKTTKRCRPLTKLPSSWPACRNPRPVTAQRNSCRNWAITNCWRRSAKAAWGRFTRPATRS